MMKKWVKILWLPVSCALAIVTIISWLYDPPVSTLISFVAGAPIGIWVAMREERL
jgi:Flp pilus assembly protein TadB